MRVNSSSASASVDGFDNFGYRVENQDGILAIEILIAHHKIDVLKHIVKVCCQFLRSDGSGIQNAIVLVGHQPVKSFIRRNKAIEARVFRSFSALFEGYGEGLWVFFGDPSESVSVESSCFI